jgi:hypothetical protein
LWLETLLVSEVLFHVLSKNLLLLKAKHLFLKFYSFSIFFNYIVLIPHQNRMILVMFDHLRIFEAHIQTLFFDCRLCLGRLNSCRLGHIVYHWLFWYIIRINSLRCWSVHARPLPDFIYLDLFFLRNNSRTWCTIVNDRCRHYNSMLSK